MGKILANKITIIQLYMESKKYSKLVSITKKANLQTQRTSGYQWGEGRGKGQYRG